MDRGRKQRVQGTGLELSGKMQKGFELQRSDLFVETHFAFDLAPERELVKKIKLIPAQSESRKSVDRSIYPFIPLRLYAVIPLRHCVFEYY